MPSAEARRADEGLLRAIGPWALAAFAFNATVGAGILGLPARIHALVGNYSVLVILLCGVMIALIALCFAEIGSRFDRTGGPQLYASIAWGPMAGFTVGWLLWVSRMASCSAIANLLIDYAGVLWPRLGEPFMRELTISAVVVGYASTNLRGIRQATAVSTFFTLAKLLVLGAFVAVGLFFIQPQALQPGPLPAPTDVATAVLLAAFAFYGFDATTVVAGEVRDPRRSIPFAILVAIAAIVTLYVLIQLVCVGTVAQLEDSERPLADAATLFVGPWGATAISLGAVISCLGVFGAVLTPATRLLFAMADQGQLPAPLARVHASYRTPHWAILATAIIVLALTLSGSFIYLVKISLIARVTVYAATCTLLPAMRRRHDVPEARFRAPGGPVLAYLCAALCVLALAASSMRELMDVALAVVTGLVIFGLTRSAQRRSAAPI